MLDQDIVYFPVNFSANSSNYGEDDPWEDLDDDVDNGDDEEDDWEDEDDE